MSEPRPPPSLATRFTGFFTIGLCGISGVLPWARRMIVEQRRWMTAAEFTELLGLCQFLPGGNIINPRSRSARGSPVRQGWSSSSPA
jgi:chromate transporter